MSGKPWTTAELAILREHYPTEGRHIVARLPGRTWHSCQQTARRYGIRYAREPLTVASMRARCEVDRATGCWLWKGATSAGKPRVYAVEYAGADGPTKREMSMARALIGLVHNRAPRGLPFMGCHNKMCANPAHVREAANRAELGEHQRRSGRLIGTHPEARRRNAALARPAVAHKHPPAATVLAMREAVAQKAGTVLQLSERFGVSYTTAKDICAGRRFRHLLPTIKEAA